MESRCHLSLLQTDKDEDDEDDFFMRSEHTHQILIRVRIACTHSAPGAVRHTERNTRVQVYRQAVGHDRVSSMGRTARSGSHGVSSGSVVRLTRIPGRYVTCSFARRAIYALNILPLIMSVTRSTPSLRFVFAFAPLRWPGTVLPDPPGCKQSILCRRRRTRLVVAPPQLAFLNLALAQPPPHSTSSTVSSYMNPLADSTPQRSSVTPDDDRTKRPPWLTKTEAVTHTFTLEGQTHTLGELLQRHRIRPLSLPNMTCNGNEIVQKQKTVWKTW
ncbi:hypothetical protein J3R83DRAFT_5955 [Lanmaoa asiatica]|nr:hypothetical protein J3R83DRAFT_5955 [Lanmaoa asiatica]